MNISLIEPQLLVAQGIKCIMQQEKNISKVTIHTSVKNFLENVNNTVPDIVLLDINIVGLNIQKLIESSNLKYKTNIKFIIFATLENVPNIQQAIREGVKGVLSKQSTSVDELTDAILEVHKGNRYICESLREKLIDIYFLNYSKLNNFTIKEIELIQSICTGIKVKEISENLNVNIHTVQYYIRKIMHKANVNRTPDLILYAIQNGLFSPQISKAG